MKLEDLRRHAISRSLFPPTTVAAAIDRLGFVQADLIRAPARAQDLALRHRVEKYRAGDLERLYPTLDIEEDFFITYGFLPRGVQALMHPRKVPGRMPAGGSRRAGLLLEFVRERGEVHPRDVDEHFSHGTVRNYWGGSSNATTHLLNHMHYRGLLRISRREKGIRIYKEGRSWEAPANGGSPGRLDAVVDVAVRKYAPLPAASLSNLVSRLRWAVPQWHRELRQAAKRARERLMHEKVDGMDWYWPAEERPEDFTADDRLRLLAPFDPVVWDRRRFEMLWGWEYRFEAYTPIRQRKLGYYALPLLWRDRVIGWANASVRNGALQVKTGFVSGRPPRDRGFKPELDDEIERLRLFLGRNPETD